MRSFLAHPREVGAVLPTSSHTVATMLDLAPIDQASLAVEFGAGSGVYTRQLLERLGPDAELLAFEIDPQLVATVTATLDDPRLRLVAASAEDVESHLDGARPDVLVSALPFTSLPAAVRHKVLDLSAAILAPGGAMLVLQYSPFIQGELKKRFATVERRISPLNVPPAFLFRCSDPRGGS